MTSRSDQETQDPRAARLKAALRANLAKRKARDRQGAANAEAATPAAREQSPDA